MATFTIVRIWWNDSTFVHVHSSVIILSGTKKPKRDRKVSKGRGRAGRIHFLGSGDGKTIWKRNKASGKEGVMHKIAEGKWGDVFGKKFSLLFGLVGKGDGRGLRMRIIPTRRQTKPYDKLFLSNVLQDEFNWWYQIDISGGIQTSEKWRWVCSCVYICVCVCRILYFCS